MPKKRVAIIGVDHYHTTGWVDSLGLFEDRLEVVALYDSDPAMGERLAPAYFDPHLSAKLDERFRDVPFTTDLDALIDGQGIDIALVTLPNVDAPEAMTKLAGAGIHMLVDKPGGPNAPAVERAIRVAHEHKVKIATGLIRRYGRGWQHAKAMLESGRAGRLLSTEAVFNTSSPFVRDPDNFIFRRELQGGGIFLWLGVHDVDQLLWLSGERIVEVQAMAAQVNEAGIDVEDAMSVAVRFQGGALGTIHYAYVLPRTLSEGYLALRGSKGSVRVAFNGAVQWIGGGTALDPVVEETLAYTNRQVPGYGAMAPAAIEDLLNAIEEDRQPLANGDDLVAALKVIDAAYESAEHGQRVTIDWN
jgi:UDP-N-acetyl-2-amino-2-deoxyglucuronate dehydrogenase